VALREGLDALAERGIELEADRVAA